MSEFKFYPIRKITITEGYTVLAEFKNGVIKEYDFTEVFHRIKPLSVLLNDYELFSQLYISPGGYGIIWNDDLDLPGEELWYNGKTVAPEAMP